MVSLFSFWVALSWLHSFPFTGFSLTLSPFLFRLLFKDPPRIPFLITVCSPGPSLSSVLLQSLQKPREYFLNILWFWVSSQLPYSPFTSGMLEGFWWWGGGVIQQPPPSIIVICSYWVRLNTKMSQLDSRNHQMIVLADVGGCGTSVTLLEGWPGNLCTSEISLVA